MKKISVVIPCFNEKDNIALFTKSVLNEFEHNLQDYDYEIIFMDNYSTDGTREILESMCSENEKLKAIFNFRNFGWNNSSFYGICQSTGDCTILISADFQEPPELIPTFVHEWEQGHKVVAAIKNHSEENPLMYFLRSIYYKIVKKFSSVEQIEHFNGFGLYDKSFVELLKDLQDSEPFLRGLVAEMGAHRKDLYYTQKARKHGKSHFNFYSLYDLAMRSFTSYTKVGLRVATFSGFAISAATMAVALVYLIFKLVWWDAFQVGMAPVVIGMFFLGAVQLFFLGLLGEYILSINTRVMHRPLVIEEKRINF